MFTKEDISYLNTRGINENEVNSQIELLKNNYSFLNITAPATIGNGIYNPLDIEEYINLYDNRYLDFKIQKFVPASGAATRMFKRMINFYKDSSLYNLNEGGFYSVKKTFEELEEFAFFYNFKSIKFDKNDFEELVEKILYSVLGYADIPKGLIEFHKYPKKPLTAFEEHIVEAQELSRKTEMMKIHFTISEEYKNKFSEKLEAVDDNLKRKIDFSFQEKSTDTVAIYDDGNLVRDSYGKLLLRPGGHGSLLQNLNKLDSDFIFIKNIDNVIHGSYLSDTIIYKKLLGGILISIIDNVYEIYTKLKVDKVRESDKNRIIEYLNLKFGASFNTNSSTSEILEFIDRPIRVCGMVKNTGEPGGGPFWVSNTKGIETLQIVEKAQIDMLDPEQAECFNNSTHFNPVDLVCYLKNPKGERLDLNKYVDKNSTFISEKTYEGKNIRVLEHPGLWNGAMSNWLTVFVEVPLITFNPVKELNDLLRKEHQPKLD